jgi:hypothetical protein
LLVALFNATVPDQVTAVVLLLVNAPTLETPVPLMVKPSVADEVNEYPFMSREAPLETVVAPPVVPNGPDELDVDDTPNFKVPVLTVVDPV